MTEPHADRALRRLVLAGGLALGLVAGGGVAWAFWSVQADTAGPGALASGDLDVRLASGALDGPGGSVTVGGLSLQNAVPGSGDAVTLNVQNDGDAPFTVTATTALTGSLGSSFTTTASFGATDTGTSCTGGSGSTSGVIEPGATAPLCVAVGLAANAPPSAQGQSGTVVVTLDATQVEQ